MAIYQVVTVPDEVLRGKSLPVAKINAGVIRVLDNMVDTLYAFDGVGLAAPQIGISRRIIVVDPGDNLIQMINPEIIFREGEKMGSEGCLSVPKVSGLVPRSEKITVRGLNREGQEVVIEASDMLARVFQHEIDHLDGILFIDKATQVKRKNA
ncbi:MAG TPA: peptide deformylase [Syntrophomonadaceae bacterium]|nr:peptide deformylase [Syntrophomonadaceae bacterium]